MRAMSLCLAASVAAAAAVCVTSAAGSSGRETTRTTVAVGAVGGAATSTPGISGRDTITTVAGNGKRGFSGDGGPATSASLAPSPYGPNFSVAVDKHGNVYIADTGNQRVREVSHANGKIRTIAGTGMLGYSGDGGPATRAQLSTPAAIAVDQQENVYIGVSGHPGSLVRKVSRSGTITTFAGGGPSVKGGGDGGPATSAFLAGAVQGLAVDGHGNVYISVSGPYDSRVRKVSRDGKIATFAGGGQSLGGGVPATSVRLSVPTGVAVDGKGNAYIGDYNASRVWKVRPDGRATIFAGGGRSRGDGGPATSASVTQPVGVAADARGNVYIASEGVRKVDPNGKITTITSGQGQSLGDRGPAMSANLTPMYVAVDAQGKNLYVSDFQHASVRKVTATAAPKTGSTTAVTTLARTLETVLTQMASQRATLHTTLSRASSCSLSASAASSQVAAVARSRQRVLDRLAKLRTPNARTTRIKSLLLAALNHSVAADLHYRDWLAHQTSRCATTRTADSSAAHREDELATAAKRKFVGVFNPLARELHLRTWTAGEILSRGQRLSASPPTGRLPL